MCQTFYRFNTLVGCRVEGLVQCSFKKWDVRHTEHTYAKRKKGGKSEI